MLFAVVLALPLLLDPTPPERLTALVDEMRRLTLAGDHAAVGRQVPAVLEELAKPHPKAAIAWNQVGVYFQTQGDFTEAERAYQRGIRLGEKDAVGGLGPSHTDLAGAHLNLARVYEHLKQWASASASAGDTGNAIEP